MAPKWEPPTEISVTCPCCHCVFKIPLKAGGMTEQQVNGILQELRELHPEIYEEEEPLNPS